MKILKNVDKSIRKSNNLLEKNLKVINRLSKIVMMVNVVNIITILVLILLLVR